MVCSERDKLKERINNENEQTRIKIDTPSGISWHPFLLIVCVVALMQASSNLLDPVMDQYLLQVFSNSLLGNVSIDTSRHPCLNSSAEENVTAKSLINQAQDKATELNLYLDFTGYSIGMVFNILVGIYSPLIHRRLLVMLPCLGLLVRASGSAAIMLWKLELNWFYLLFVVYGICGNKAGLFLGTFLYTSDITTRDHKRTLGIVVLEGLKGIVAAGVMAFSGRLIEKYGFYVPCALATGLVFLSGVFIIMLPNRKPEVLEKIQKDWSLKKALNSMILPFNTVEGKHVRKMLFLVLITFFSFLFVACGLAKIRTMYLMNLPFCMNSITIGWFLCTRELCLNIFTIFAVSVFSKCFPGMALGMFGSIFTVASFLLYALAETQKQLWGTVVLEMGHLLPIGLARGEASTLLGPELQGPLFASLAMLESISFAAGPPVFLSLYRYSLYSVKGLQYFIGASFVFIILFFLIWFQKLWLKHMTKITYKELQVQVEPKDETAQHVLNKQVQF